MNLSLLMITLIPKRCRLTIYEGQQILSEDFCGRKFRQRPAKSVHGKMALPYILNKTAVAFSTQ